MNEPERGGVKKEKLNEIKKKKIIIKREIINTKHIGRKKCSTACRAVCVHWSRMNNLTLAVRVLI